MQTEMSKLKILKLLNNNHFKSGIKFAIIILILEKHKIKYKITLSPGRRLTFLLYKDIMQKN